MMRIMTVAVALAMSSASAQEALTVGQCLNVLRGITALNCAGAQLGEGCPAVKDARQYKLGAVRGVLGLNSAALSTVFDGFQKARLSLLNEHVSRTGKDEKTVMDSAAFLNDLQAMLDRPCPVHPARIKMSDLHLGDGDGDNQIPPSVVGALSPIIDAK